MRIAYLASLKTANGYYRGHGPMAMLGATGGHQLHKLEDEDRHCPPGVDVLHIHRYSEPRTLAIALEAKAQRAAVVWDNDDDQSAMPKSIVTHKHFSGYAWRERRADVQRLFKLTDLVTAPNATLVTRLCELGAPRGEVLENFLLSEPISPSRRPGTSVTIGWIAGLEHQMDVERIPIRAALQRLLDERPEVSVVTVGLRLGLQSERYRSVKHVALPELAQAAAEFDIAIAPLADLDFNRARSNIKLKEYAAAAVPWLASPIGPYAGMGEREGGRLVPDDRWFEELTRLIDKPRERRKLAKRAATWARGETIHANVHRWEQLLRSAVEHSRSAAPA